MDIQFQEDEHLRRSSTAKRTGIIGWLTRTGMVSTSRQAETVLLVVAVLALIAAWYIAFDRDTVDPASLPTRPMEEPRR
ncbi:MAG TPA: hypothetical protein VGB97_01635 [Candidatus Paceibacterota bacterium]|jgi:hypothetical protein